MLLRSIPVLLLFAPALRAEDKPLHADLARLIHDMIVPQVPRNYEDSSEWGKMIPLPADLRLPRARRTIVMVDGRPHVPQGAWKRTKLVVEDPARDVQVRVTSLESAGRDKSRLGLEVTAALHGERQREQWVKGLRLLDLTVQADAIVVGNLDVELTARFDRSKFPPELIVTPKILQTKLELRRFDLNRIGPVLLGEKEARDLGEELKGALQELLRQYEPEVDEKLNQAVAKALKDGQAKLSPATLLKLNPGEKK